MEEKQFAELNPEQLEKINELERLIGVTLIAYDNQGLQQGTGSYSNSAQEDYSS